jgi:hypothetical protein
MNARRTFTVALILCWPLIAPITASAEGFEGTLKVRTISVDTEHLSALLNGKPATDPQSVFAIPVDKLLALKGTAGSGVEVTEPTISIKGSKLRAENVGRERDEYMIMDLDSGTSWMVMPKDKQYVEWTKADTEAMANKMEEMRKAMDERMAKLPPEQRQQMEAMMKGIHGMPGAPAEAPKVEVHPLGKSQTVDGMQTTGYEARQGTETAEAWVTQDYKELQHTFHAMQENMRKMAPGRKPGEKDIRAALAEYGLPVRVQALDGRQYRVEDLVEVQKKGVADDLFAVPAGFQKKTPQGMMAPGMHGHPAQ